MKFFVIVPMMIFGASFFNLQMPSPSSPQNMDLSRQEIHVMQNIAVDKIAVRKSSEVGNKISDLDKANRMARALAASV